MWSRLKDAPRLHVREVVCLCGFVGKYIGLRGCAVLCDRLVQSVLLLMNYADQKWRIAPKKYNPFIIYMGYHAPL